jgi:ubiquinone/menaquinone biosynthesis C-methylase UbiE
VEFNAKNFHGKTLDIGCGIQPYKEILKKYCDEIIGIDQLISLHGLSEVNVACSGMQLPFKENSFDNIVSFQVLEHTPEPLEVLKEGKRVLKTGGYFLITTPFMWGEHETPYDFYRYTRYGLKYLAEKSGFKVVSIAPDTKYWATAVLRFNYYLIRFARGPLKPLIKFMMLPIFYLDQFIAYFLDSFPHNYTIDTASFTTLLKKAN